MMRYIDLTMALIIGVSSLASVVAWNPSQYENDSRQSASNVALRTFLVDAMAGSGIRRFVTGQLTELCAWAESTSNRTLLVSVLYAGETCGPSPTWGNRITIEVPRDQGEVTIEAWRA